MNRDAFEQPHQPKQSEAQPQGGPIGPVQGCPSINLPAGSSASQPINLPEKMRDKFEALKAMNTLAKAINDESFYYERWIEIIPDEADDEELLEIAQEDDDTFGDAVRCFINYFGRYAQKGGLYIGGECWLD